MQFCHFLEVFSVLFVFVQFIVRTAFFLFHFYKRMNVVRAAAVAVIVRRIELAHCLTPWLQLSVLQHNTFVLTVEFFSVKMHEKKDFSLA